MTPSARAAKVAELVAGNTERELQWCLGIVLGYDPEVIFDDADDLSWSVRIGDYVAAKAKTRSEAMAAAIVYVKNRAILNPAASANCECGAEPHIHIDQSSARVVCWRCGWTGPWCDNPNGAKDAVVAWNRVMGHKS